MPSQTLDATHRPFGFDYGLRPLLRVTRGGAAKSEAFCFIAPRTGCRGRQSLRNDGSKPLPQSPTDQETTHKLATTGEMCFPDLFTARARKFSTVSTVSTIPLRACALRKEKIKIGFIVVVVVVIEYDSRIRFSNTNTGTFACICMHLLANAFISCACI